MGKCGRGTMYSVAAFAISLLLLYAVKGSPAAGLLDSGIDLRGNAGIIAASACIAVLFGVLSSLYPAFYVTSISPAIALKGNFGLSPSGKRTRTILVGVQFTASFILIITASFIYLQNRFMLKAPLGFDKDCIISTDINGNIRKNLDAFSGEIRKIAGVEDIAFTQLNIGVADFYPTWIRGYKDERISFSCIPVSYNFLDVMGIYLIDGERPTQRDEESPTLFFYEPLAKQYGITALDKIDNEGGQTKVGGIVSSPKFSSLKNEMTDAALIIGDNYPMKVSYIRMKAGADASEVIAYVKQTIHALDPTYPADVETYPTVLNQFYEKDEQLMQMVYVFSSLAIILSLMGVFSLVMFETLYRKKEIGIRKVLGASIYEVLMMFGCRYFWIVLICSVIAIPFAYYGVNLWLQNFAYKTPIHWWLFLLAFALIGGITLLTVWLQCRQVARENPILSIRTE